jgi:hypothetical protein
VDGAHQVDVDHPAPVLERRRLDGRGVADAGIVVEDVDRPGRGEYPLGEPLDRAGVGDVERIGGGDAAPGLDLARTRSAASPSRSLAWTLAPSRPNSSAVARPIPDPAPVITTTAPENSAIAAGP